MTYQPRREGRAQKPNGIEACFHFGSRFPDKFA